MEIIKPGEADTERTYDARCVYCHCHVRFRKGEATYHSSPKNEQYLSVKCPTPKCPHRIYVEL